MKQLLAAVLVLAAAAPAFAQDQQLGARTKAMGGSYTAFEDDPVSVWLNPAGIAAQPDSGSICYQTYVGYPLKEKGGSGSPVTFESQAEPTVVDPVLLPSYLGFVFQLGSPEDPLAIGVCFARPYHLRYSLSRVSSPTQTTFDPNASVEESLARFRIAVAKDFRFKKTDEPGWFTHLSVGVGVDVGYEKWDFTENSTDVFGTSSTVNSDTVLGFGFGAGVLVCIYSDNETVRVNFGVAYQSFIKYDHDIEPDILPSFDMPQQLNVGVTFYLLQDLPLRITFDFQWIDWSETAEGPLFPGQPEFVDAFNFSFGVEYRIKISDKVNLYPRLGYRRFQAPWDDKDDLPMTGVFKLVLDTKSESFNVFTFGAGISWTTESGKLRSIDIGADAGADTFTVALGYTHEF